jgi:site-specific DNA-methyltransferase (adenine-specific)
MQLPSIFLDTIFLEPFETGLGRIPDGAVDLILTDPPYGVTDLAWDKRPDLPAMWQAFDRVLKPSGAAVMTATQPFATDLIQSNRKYFRYDLVWAKSNPVGFLNARRMPLRQHELVLVFYRRLPSYNPQMLPNSSKVSRQLKASSNVLSKPGVYAQHAILARESHGRYPTSLLPVAKDGAGAGRHPTQKPEPLFEYLIRTYSNLGDLILDPFMGSGTTAVAAKRAGRHFIGFEIEEAYYEMALERIEKTDTISPFTKT